MGLPEIVGILKLLCVSKILGWCPKSKGKTFRLSSPQIWSPISNVTTILIPLLAPGEGDMVLQQGAKVYTVGLRLIVSGGGCLKCHRVLEGSQSCYPALHCLPPLQPGVVRPDMLCQGQPRVHGRAELLSLICPGDDLSPILQDLTSVAEPGSPSTPPHPLPASVLGCWRVPCQHKQVLGSPQSKHDH